MDVATVVDVINHDIIYRPGWTWKAEDFTSRHEGAVKVSVVYEAQNFTRAHAPEYAESVKGGAKASFIVSANEVTDPLDLHRRVLAGFQAIESHESREAYRVGRAYWGPFNPHNVDGQTNWGDQQGDYGFGLV